LNLEKVRRETGGDEPSSDQIFHITSPKGLVCAREGTYLEYFCFMTNQKRLGSDVTAGPQNQELGVSIGNSCLACCYGSQASHWKKLDEGAPALCGSFLSYVWPWERGDKWSNRTWLT
jgi:hypothetical protein